MMRVLRFAPIAVAIGLLAFAAVALAGTQTVNDNKDGAPKCQDIDKVAGNAGNIVSTFKITMIGNAKADPCNGKVSPSVNIGVKHGQCSAFIYQGKQVLNCEGGGGGSATVAISHHDSHVWKVKFHTKDLPGKPTKFDFSVSCGTGHAYDDTLDVNHNNPVSITIG